MVDPEVFLVLRGLNHDASSVSMGWGGGSKDEEGVAEHPPPPGTPTTCLVPQILFQENSTPCITVHHIIVTQHHVSIMLQ